MIADDYVVSGVFNEKTGLLYVGGNKGNLSGRHKDSRGDVDSK